VPTDETVKKLYDEMDIQRATQAYLWSFRSAPLCHQINACAFSQHPTDAHWHRALEHDCKIRPING
jgi:hypothetical protein